MPRPRGDHRAGPVPEQLPALTGIRLPLALWVVGHHLIGRRGMLDPLTAASPTIRGLLEAAWSAVAIFFVISGFVIARRYRATVWTRSALGRYAVARFARIYPLYFASLVILAPIIVHAMLYGPFGTHAQRAGLLGNYLFLLQGWHWPAATWNTPAWSLSCEMFFYACAPALLWLVRIPSWPRVLTTVCLACAVPLTLRLLIPAPIPKALLYFGDFLIGVAAAGVYEQCRRRRTPVHRLGPWLYWPALIAILALLLDRAVFGWSPTFDTGLRLASGLLVLGLACGGGWLVRALSSRVALTGGYASYAIYILHVPILWWYQRSIVYKSLPGVYAALPYVALVLVVSVAASHWYERPVNAFLRRWYAGREMRGSNDMAAVAWLAERTGRRAGQRIGRREGPLWRRAAGRTHRSEPAAAARRESAAPPRRM